jgi:hypothetical protein
MRVWCQIKYPPNNTTLFSWYPHTAMKNYPDFPSIFISLGSKKLVIE